MTKYLQFLLLFVGIYAFSQVPINVKVKDALGNENFHVTCTNNLDTNGCIPLQVEFPVLKQTTTYQVTQGAYNPPIPLNQGTSINANFDDVFTSKIDLPFKFCFFNQYFESIVIGSNGMVTFDLNQQSNINYPNVQWQNPNSGLPKNSIFGVYHDLVFSAGDSSEIYYSTLGTAPYRKFVINFFDGRVAGCTDRSSSQIVLHETTHIVEVFVDQKLSPCATRKFENALIGIINDTGSLGYSPASRNTGNWQASQESWVFTPTGNSIQPTVTWTNSAGQTVGTGIQTILCPTQNEVYTANVNFNICGNSNLILTDDFVLDFDPTYPISKNYSQDYCGNSPVQLNLNDLKPNVTSQNPANFNFTYHTSLVDAQNNQNGISSSYSLNTNTVLYVRIQNPSVPGCFRVAVLTLNFSTKNLLTDIISLCDTNNDGIEPAYDLSLLNNQLFPAGGTNIVYFLSQSNAQNNINSVITADITATTKIWARVQYGDCTYVLGPVNFSFKTGANVNSPISFPYTMCDINADNSEVFDFSVNLGPLISSQGGSVFTAYETFNGAYYQSGSALEKIKKGIYTIYVRVQIPGGCFTVVPVNMNITFTEILANDKNEYICFNGTDDITVNLATLSTNNMLTLPATVPFTKFYETYDDAMEDENSVVSTHIITENGSLVTKTFYVRFEESEDCYTVRAINVNLVHPVIVASSFNVCDFNNDNSENVNLSQFSGAVIGNQYATVTYYLTQTEAQNGTNPITNTNVVGTKQLFVKINSYNCSQIYPINIGLVSTPAVNPTVNIALNNICDNNNDGVELYNLLSAQSQIYTGSNVTFSYYTSYDSSTHLFSGEISNPGEYPVPGNATVYVKIKFNNNECFSASKLNIQMTFLPAVILTNAVLNKCDEDFNLSETFTLNDAVLQMYSTQNTYPLSDMSISYYQTSAEANVGNLSTQIGNSLVTSVSTVQVWVRFQSKTSGCFSVAKIELNTYFPPKAINSSITVCDDNLDGVYEVNLLNYTNLYVDIPNQINTFTFYLTQNDAQNGTNAIANPQNFTANPFPQQIWVKVMNIPGCDDIASINFIIGNKVVLQNSGPFLLNNICDILNDGIENVNLAQFQSQMYSGNNVTFTYYTSLADLNASTNAIANPSNYSFNENSGSDTIFVKVNVPGLCPELTTIKISLKKVPFFEIPTQFFCPDGTFSYTLQVKDHNIVSYVWTNPAGQIVSSTDTLVNALMVGIYSVTVTSDNGCSYTATFEAKYYDVPVIQQMVASGNTYTITATGSQPIVYSIDGFNWQESNVFYNLPTGVTTFYVKYVEGKCIVKQDGVILDIKNAITPNGDGKNDKWIIKNLHVFGNKKTNVKVFDRYQYKIFEQDTNTQIIWDGTISGRPIPTSSYWYIITLPDGRSFTGWLLVKNNN